MENLEKKMNKETRLIYFALKELLSLWNMENLEKKMNKETRLIYFALKELLSLLKKGKKLEDVTILFD